MSRSDLSVNLLPQSKNCPRCGSPFLCQPNNISQCQCSQVNLSEATQSYLQKTQYDCLCANCLQELNELVERAAVSKFPRKGDLLVEGLHFYKENENLVFTEFYHILRGRCCKSGCRHCAYGFHIEHSLES